MDEDLTADGPEPSPPEGREPRKRLNVDAILLMAKYDEDFRKKLLADRSAALDGTGLLLSEGEKLLLNGICDEQLSSNIQEFRVSGISKESLPTWNNGPAVLLLLTSQTPTESDRESELTFEDFAHITGIGPDDRASRKRRKKRRGDPPAPLGTTPDDFDLDDRRPKD